MAFTMRVCVFILLTACGGLRSMAGGGGGGTGVGGGQQGAGGGGLNFGGGYGGGSGQYEIQDGGFSFQDISPVDTGPSYQRIAGRSLTDVVLGDSDGSVQHFDGAAWSVWATFPDTPNFTGLYMAPTGDIFATGDAERIYWCASNCSDLASWSYEDHGGNVFAGLCATSADTVYAVGHSQSDESGVVFKFQPPTQMWEQLSGTNFAKDYAACTLAPDGTLFLAARRYVVEVSPQGMAKQVDLTGMVILAGFDQWRAITMMGDEVVAVGDNKRVARRSAGGQWSMLLDGANEDLTVWTAVQSLRAGEALIGGSGGDNIVNIGTMGLVGDSPVVATFMAPFDFYVRDMWLADEHTLFIVGQAHTLEGPQVDVVYRATR
jgi:hypothetical protein